MKDFSQLKALREQLKDQGQERALEEARRARAEREARERAEEFGNSMKGVKKMPASDRHEHRAPVSVTQRGLEARAALTPEQETAAVLRESLSDLFDVDGLLDEDPSLSYAQDGVGPDVVRKLRKRHWPVQDELDLHGLTRDGARDALTDFLYRANRRGVRCVRIIHGIGYGSPKGEPVLRGIVHSWLVQKSEVVAFCVAGRKDGGHGALIVLLRSALLD